MPWGAQQWLRLTRENAYGVRNPSPSGSDVLWIRLYQANPFGMRPVPQRQIIRSADAGNRRRQVVAARKVLTGTLNTLLYPSQASYLMTALTTFSSNDLNSYTIDYFDSTRIQGYLGCKARVGTITSQATQDYLTISVDWIGQQLDSSFVSFAQPVDGNFPLEVPYEHAESAGQMTVGGSTLSLYNSCGVTIGNVIVGTWDEQPYITRAYYCGRDVNFSFGAQYIATTFRTAFEAQSTLTCSLKWNRPSGPNSVTLNCETKTYIGSISDQIPLDGPAYQTVAFESFYDVGGSTDLAVTVV
jgi:hypothetical protein